MANTFTCLHYHIVCSTKHREPGLRPELRERVWAYLGGIARQHDLTPVLVGGMDDHIHILLGMPATVTVSEALKRIKGGSSGWIKENLTGCRGLGARQISSTMRPAPGCRCGRHDY